MTEVSVEKLSEYLMSIVYPIEAGEEITVTRNGKAVARLVPPSNGVNRLPDLTEFRASIKLRGEGMSETVIKERRESRY